MSYNEELQGNNAALEEILRLANEMPVGVAIVSIEQTTKSTEDGGVNVWTVTLTDGSTQTFEVQNGSSGGFPLIINAGGVNKEKLPILTTNEATGAKYTAVEIGNLAEVRPIVLRTKNVSTGGTKEGIFRYYRTVDVSGVFAYVEFVGHYDDIDSGKWVPATAKIGTDNLVEVIGEEWLSSGSGGSSDGTSGGTSINVTAEVGQTIIVKEVDADGKPTAWEAAEYQPRTHWDKEVTELPETVFTFDEEMDVFIAPGTISPNYYDVYTVVWNGATYDNVTPSVVGADMMIGNPSVVGGTDNGLPFLIVPIAEGFLVCLPLDGAASVTMELRKKTSVKIPRKYLGEMGVFWININQNDDGTWTTDATPNDVLEAMRSGRMIAVMDNSWGTCTYLTYMNNITTAPDFIATGGIYKYQFGVNDNAEDPMNTPYLCEVS